MRTIWGEALWPQFGAALDMLDEAIAACPDALWTRSLWSVEPSSGFPPQFGEFWYVAYHTIVWADLYGAGVAEEGFAPPAPFARGELDAAESMPERPYTREALRAYLAATRERARARLSALTEKQAHRPVEYPWSEGSPVSYLELQLYTLRHIQGHAAQLNLALGQSGVPDVPDWVARARSR